MQSQTKDAESDTWMQIEPLLETAMSQLGEKDHDALVLRFLQGRTFKDVSGALGTSEAGAKMRVNRALEKLRTFFTKRGMKFSVALIAGAISAHSVQAAPLGLATSVTIATFKEATLTASTATLIKTTLKTMAWTKIKTTVVVGVITLVAASTATVAIRTSKTTGTSTETSPAHTHFRFKGYGTPEDSVETLLWLAGKGDVEKFEANMTPEEMERFKGVMQGKSDEELKRRSIAMAKAMVGYKIAQKEVISNDEVHLHLSAPPAIDGLRSGSVIISMKKIGNQWRHAGEVN